MVPVLIVMGIIVYLMIGGFLSGMLARELEVCTVFAWPFILVFILCMVFAKFTVNLGKKYYNRVNKWLDNHL